MSDPSVEFDLAGEDDEGQLQPAQNFNQAVVHATDWTTETVVSQLRRGNIALNPRFQRRDAWTTQQKSRFIESLIMGLPVPQIVLAESKGERGKYLVLDGKQRLLSLLQFAGLGEGEKNRFALTGLKELTNLNRKRFDDLEHEPDFLQELNALQNQTVRTVVIRNWPDTDFLHLVFLRLNTGSTKLSPQELRQALKPGPFTDWVDESAAGSRPLHELLNISEPDYRMRDTEILARFVAFTRFLEDYPGRMKKFLDDSFENMNSRWSNADNPDGVGTEQQAIISSFDSGLDALIKIFGADTARRPRSALLNRTLLDMLLYYAKDAHVCDAMVRSPERVRDAYADLFVDNEFVSAIESDTARTSGTALRFRKWGEALQSTIGMPLSLPSIESIGGSERIRINA